MVVSDDGMTSVAIDPVRYDEPSGEQIYSATCGCGWTLNPEDMLRMDLTDVINTAGTHVDGRRQAGKA